MARDNSQNTNLAAEFFVASQLFRRGYAVTITFGHTKEIDLIVANPGKRIFTIDVKGLKNKSNWPPKPKRRSKDHFFVLVSYLGVTVQPEVFVIPSTRIWSGLGAWTGNPTVTAVDYRRVKNSRHKDGWDFLPR